MTNEVFDEVIGQNSAKATLSLYIDAYQQTGRIQALNLVAQKGFGKNLIVRKFREGLKRPDGSRPPILEVNCATIQSPQNFFENIYPVWTQHRAILFADEAQCLPTSLQSLLLSILEVKKDPIRTVEFNGVPYTFNFDEISFISGTTDKQKLLSPLQDRLREINLEDYRDSELLEIFELNLENRVNLTDCARNSIIPTFRGNPRDAVVKVQDLLTYVSAKQIKNVDTNVWGEFCGVMAILPMGLSFSEIQVLKAIGKRGTCSLTDISSITGFDRSLIQRSLEGILVRKGLMKVDGKRSLTGDGIRFYHKYCA